MKVDLVDPPKWKEEIQKKKQLQACNSVTNSVQLDCSVLILD